MESLLRGYQVNEPTWLYLSCLLILAAFCRFGRIVSVRNLDLGLLLSIAPGLLLVRTQPTFGYVWLFIVSACLLVRVLMDPVAGRRPQLHPNLNVGGLTFLCAAAFIFLMARVMTEPPHPSTVNSVKEAESLLDGKPPLAASRTVDAPAGPASPLITAPVVQISRVTTDRWNVETVAARLLVVMAHLAVILGLIFVGRHLFADHGGGTAMATMYMLLPCTAFDVGKAIHVLPAALIVWSLYCYRRPVISGLLLGLACGMLAFPILLLPLWCVFYGRRGSVRFAAAVALMAGVMLSIQFLTTPGAHDSVQQILGYLEWEQLQFGMTDVHAVGFWRSHDVAWRIPVFVTYLVMLAALMIWPRKKHLGHLIAHSAAIIIGIQFWYLQAGGVYVLWYLPLLLVMVFRPTLTQHSPPEMAPLLGSGQARAGSAASTSMATFSRWHLPT